MRVTVRLFARLREAAGAADCECVVGPHATVADVWDALAARYPPVAPFARTVSAAINAEFASRTAAVREGDEVAFLPPVSGG
jgi:molybdopterin converting factor subunit 1